MPLLPTQDCWLTKRAVGGDYLQCKQRPVGRSLRAKTFSLRQDVLRCDRRRWGDLGFLLLDRFSRLQSTTRGGAFDLMKVIWHTNNMTLPSGLGPNLSANPMG